MKTKHFNKLFLGTDKIKLSLLNSNEEMITVIDAENNIMQYCLHLSSDTGGKITLKKVDETVEIFTGSNTQCKDIFDSIKDSKISDKNRKSLFIKACALIIPIVAVSIVGISHLHKPNHYNNYNSNDYYNSNNMMPNNMTYSGNHFRNDHPKREFIQGCDTSVETNTCNLSQSQNSIDDFSDSLLPPKTMSETQQNEDNYQEEVGEPVFQKNGEIASEKPINLDIGGFSVSDTLEQAIVLEDVPNTTPEIPAINNSESLNISEATEEDAVIPELPTIFVQNEKEILELNILVRDLIERGDLIPINLANQLDANLRSLLEEGDLIEKEETLYISEKAALQNLYRIRNKDQDAYGIPKLPEPNSLITLSKYLNIPLPGGGDAEDPEEFKSFGLYLMEKSEATVSE